MSVDPAIVEGTTDDLPTLNTPPTKGSVQDLLNFAAARYQEVRHHFRVAVVRFWEMGKAFAEIQDRFDKHNAGLSKRDPNWLSFEKAVAGTGVSENTARKAADVSRRFKTVEELHGLTIGAAVEYARSLDAPETPAEKVERLRKAAEKAEEYTAAADRILTKDAEKAENPPTDQPPDQQKEPTEAESYEVVVSDVEQVRALIARAASAVTRLKSRRGIDLDKLAEARTALAALIKRVRSLPEV